MDARFLRIHSDCPVREISRNGAAFRFGERIPQLIVQPIDATEISLAEWDLKDQGYGAAEVAALAVQHIHADSAYIVEREMGSLEL